jgi:hypothetical protein
MSKKDFSNLLQQDTSVKPVKYNHYKPFHEPIDDDKKINSNLEIKQANDVFEKIEKVPSTNRTQTEHKSNTNRTQTEHKSNTNKPKEKEIEHKLNTELNTEVDTNWTQTEHKLNTKTTFSSLVGLQKKLVVLIYNECKAARSKTTKNLSVEYISSVLKVPRGSIKTTIKRIEDKGFISRVSSKIGRGGCTSYLVPDFLFQELLQHETEHKLDTNRTQTGHKPDTELNTTLPVVSSYLLNTNYGSKDIPDSWKGMELTSLESIGFDFSHLVQIHRAYEKSPGIALSPELIQSSIDAFAFDLKNNDIEKKFKSSAATVLLSLLKKGHPYNSITPDKCISPVQDALNKHNQMLLVQRAKEQQLLQQIKDTEFSVWIEELPEEELLLLCPEKEVPLKDSEKLFKTVRKRMAREKAKDYFDAEIWPSKKQSILASAKRKLMQNEEPQQTNDEVEQ